MRKQTTSATPAKLGTVYAAWARIQVIQVNTMRYETLATCLDTPNAIAAEIARVRKDHPHASIWVSGDVSGRKYHGQK